MFTDDSVANWKERCSPRVKREEVRRVCDVALALAAVTQPHVVPAGADLFVALCPRA